jgi:hypothetical protein
VDAKVRQLVDLGATMLEASDWNPDFYAVAMKDPEGNEFDIN